MSAKKEFTHKSNNDRDFLIAFIERLGNGFANGRIYLQNRKDSIDLAPDGLIQFQLKARMKDGKGKISIEFDWKEK